MVFAMVLGGLRRCEVLGLRLGDIQVPQPETPRSSEKRSTGWGEYTGAASGADATSVGAPVTTTTISK